MTLAPARMLLLALASMDTGDLMRMTPDDPAEADRFRAVVRSVQRGEVETMRETLDAFLGADHWRERLWHGDHLASFGDEAVHAVAWAIDLDDLEDRVIGDCYDWLIRRFPEHPRTIRVAINGGLQSDVPGVRYRCAFYLGSQRAYEAHLRLRRLVDDRELDELTRYAAAKSLAELGEPDAVRMLYEAAGSDAFMPRHMAHFGLKALAGRSLDDFGDYRYNEGAMVSGGNEYMMAFDGVTLAEKRAGRYRALADFCSWLKADRPELYKHLTAVGW